MHSVAGRIVAGVSDGTAGSARQLPMRERCVLILAWLDGEASAVQVRDVLISEGEPPGRLDAAGGLRYAARVKSPPLAELVGRRSRGWTPVCRLTVAGNAWADGNAAAGPARTALLAARHA